MSVVVAPLALILPVENLLGMLLPGANILPHPLTTALLVPVIHLVGGHSSVGVVHVILNCWPMFLVARADRVCWRQRLLERIYNGECV